MHSGLYAKRRRLIVCRSSVWISLQDRSVRSLPLETGDEKRKRTHMCAQLWGTHTHTYVTVKIHTCTFTREKLFFAAQRNSIYRHFFIYKIYFQKFLVLSEIKFILIKYFIENVSITFYWKRVEEVNLPNSSARPREKVDNRRRQDSNRRSAHKHVGIRTSVHTTRTCSVEAESFSFWGRIFLFSLYSICYGCKRNFGSRFPHNFSFRKISNFFSKIY